MKSITVLNKVISFEGDFGYELSDSMIQEFSSNAALCSTDEQLSVLVMSYCDHIKYIDKTDAMKAVILALSSNHYVIFRIIL
jgi:hypothetical protein